MDEPVTLHVGNCLDVLADMEPASVDAIVTDPPYEIGFMSRNWDASGIAYNAEVWRQCLRVLRPGGHLLAFGGTRTYHRLTCAIEDAGFEVRDSLHWIYGSGFPKSLSVHKATLKPVESRYAEAQCDCLDTRDGSPVGHDAGQGGSRPVRARRGAGEVPAAQAGNRTLPREPLACDGALRELRQGNRAEAAGRAPVGSPLLLTDVRGRGTEEEGFGDSSVRPGVEEHPGEGPEAGQGLPILRCCTGSGGCAACASPEAVSVRRDEPAVESGLAVRCMSSHDRGGDDFGPVVDPSRCDPRRLYLDDHGGRRPAVAWVCSWCALPDRGWLDSLKPLGSALKPAHEPIVLARKPLAGTVAATVLAHGTGGLNIDGCRVAATPDLMAKNPHTRSISNGFGEERAGATYDPSAGRWPANVLLSHPPLLDGAGAVVGDACAGGCVDGCPVAEMDAQSGVTPSNNSRNKGRGLGYHGATGERGAWSGDTGGGASRFFPTFRYQAKAPRSERPRLADGTTHPTVKPLALMRWLVTLVTPPGGVVLDPFAGSGTTGEAAALEGMRAVLIEMDEVHAELIRVRLAKPAA